MVLLLLVERRRHFDCLEPSNPPSSKRVVHTDVPRVRGVMRGSPGVMCAGHGHSARPPLGRERFAPKLLEGRKSERDDTTRPAASCNDRYAGPRPHPAHVHDYRNQVPPPATTHLFAEDFWAKRSSTFLALPPLLPSPYSQERAYNNFMLTSTPPGLVDLLPTPPSRVRANQPCRYLGSKYDMTLCRCATHREQKKEGERCATHRGTVYLFISLCMMCSEL